ncbi:MAG: hypothetical protein ABXS93_05745 [Sulfurimonas sp.]
MSENTPLISNLNMVENLALIKEFHQQKSVKKAEKEALIYLRAIGLEEIALKRVNECNKYHILSVMVLRALLSSAETVVVVMPFSIVSNLRHIDQCLKKLNKVKRDKTILVLDTYLHRNQYKGELCHIIE